VRSTELFDRILDRYGNSHPDHCDRLTYIFFAQQRFSTMLEAWKAGDIETVGRVFREDGIGLRDQYKISGPELESMCDIARTVPGVLGERMLGGGDKGATGALVRADSVEALEKAVRTGYPRSHPAFADGFAVHVCRVVDGITTLNETL
jgi:galactokinase